MHHASGVRVSQHDSRHPVYSRATASCTAGVNGIIKSIRLVGEAMSPVPALGRSSCVRTSSKTRPHNAGDTTPETCAAPKCSSRWATPAPAPAPAPPSAAPCRHEDGGGGCSGVGGACVLVFVLPHPAPVAASIRGSGRGKAAHRLLCATASASSAVTASLAAPVASSNARDKLSAASLKL